MDAGALRDLITLQQNTPTQGLGGAPVDVWANLADTPTTWGAVEPLGGREFFEAARVNAEVTHRIRIRYRADVTPRMRALLGARVFDIEAVLEMVRRRELHLMVREVTS